MAKRRRINITIDDILYARLTRIKENYGFKNVCELGVAVLNILATHIEAKELAQQPDMDSDDEYREIESMFNELATWERTPNGVVPKRDHRPQKR